MSPHVTRRKSGRLVSGRDEDFGRRKNAGSRLLLGSSALSVSSAGDTFETTCLNAHLSDTPERGKLGRRAHFERYDLRVQADDRGVE